MSRKIKFRAFINNKMQWIAKAGLGDVLYLPPGLGEWKSIPFAECEVMQFTGLTDKHGKDIYEGDRLINPDGNIGEVVFKDGSFKLKVFKRKNYWVYITLNQGFLNNKIIHSNIFENPILTNA